MLLPIGLILTVATFCMQLALAAWRRDERALAQAAFGTMTGVLFGFCALSFTAVAITVVDALSGGLFQAANMSVDDAVRRLVMVSQLETMDTLGWAVPALVALGFAIGSFMYWGVMVARKVGILVLVSLAVFAGAGGGWEVAKRWRRGWIEATATLVVSKLLMTVVFLIGVSAMGKADADDGLTALSDALAGIVIMAMVLLCPYATYKFVHWASDGGGQDDAHRAGTAGFAAIAGTAKTAATLAVQMHTGSPAPQGPDKIPGAGEGGVVSGIDPSGGASNEGLRRGSAEAADNVPPRRELGRLRRQGRRPDPASWRARLDPQVPGRGAGRQRDGRRPGVERKYCRAARRHRGPRGRCREPGVGPRRGSSRRPAAQHRLHGNEPLGPTAHRSLTACITETAATHPVAQVRTTPIALPERDRPMPGRAPHLPSPPPTPDDQEAPCPIPPRPP